jgi:signal transduction histidine kinase
VYAAVSLAEVHRTISALAGLLAAGLPLLLVLVAGTTMLMVRLALRPVDAIRAEVTEITGRDLHRRVPEPPTDDEIGRLANTMNIMLDRLESFSRRQQEFVADVSHELQSPLAASRTELEVALHHTAAADWSRAARTALDEHDRMERLVHDLLLLARTDEGSLEVGHVRVDLDDVVRSEIARLSDRARVRIDARAVEPVEVRGNADLLAQVVRNLLENANRHAATGVEVGLRDRDGAVLTVSDDGPGVRADDRERIFQRFTRADASRERGIGGSGLGLAIARRIVELHGGRIFVDGGARFVVELPR